MKTSKKLIAEIKDAREWIERNKIFVSYLSQNKMYNFNTGESKEMNESELFMKPTWIINNLITQTQQYELILKNSKEIINTF